MKNQHQTKKLGLKKLNITLLTSHKLSQIKAGNIETGGIHGCDQSGPGCRSIYPPQCGNQTDIKDLAAYR
ncbi:hypothetical protein ATO12_09110 [Aquimarina atlantica]|uniref:Uncharacterized protein n=1 Tax=Aquimarina atlantica TaxID=1317122 RepID=A0A023BZ12_9FLAO|nr:hypothetical protein [Aquimarina atlantica]EZH74888.1 hypothetical protein ATO12_09110 [Aquimarina atlantica]